MDSYTIGMTIGMIIGISIGISIGILIGKKQKPWSELSKKEKFHKKTIVITGFVILMIGFIFNLYLFKYW